MCSKRKEKGKMQEQHGHAAGLNAFIVKPAVQKVRITQKFGINVFGNVTDVHKLLLIGMN